MAYKARLYVAIFSIKQKIAYCDIKKHLIDFSPTINTSHSQILPVTFLDFLKQNHFKLFSRKKGA